MRNPFLAIPLCLVASWSTAQGAEESNVKPITIVPLVFTSPFAEYENVPRWGLDQWSQAEVEALFVSMKKDGVETVLLPIPVGKQAFHDSDILPNTLGYDAYAWLFDLAEKYGMEVVLPGICYTYYGQFQGKGWDPRADLDMNKRFCRELFEKYGDRKNIWGWYIPHETGDRTHRGDIMTILRELPPFLKQLTPDRKVSHSPWFTSRLTIGEDATTPAKFAAEWDAMLSEIEDIDVFLIQDATAPREEIGDWFAAAAPVFRKHGVELWSVVELFHREPVLDLTSCKPFEQVLGQMRMAAPYVDRYACWEYQNFLYPLSPLSGVAELSRKYRAYWGR